MIDLDELRVKWGQQDGKLDEVIRINMRLLNAERLNRVRPGMQRLAVWLTIEAAIQAGCLVAIGSFLGDHFNEPRFAVPAAVLHVFAIGIFIGLVRQVLAARQIDFNDPISTIQKHLQELRMLRIRYTQAILLCSALIWTPLLIVGLKALLGADAYSMFGAAYLWSNVAFGAALIPLGIWISRRFADSPHSSRVMRALTRDILGRNFANAENLARSIGEFEKE